MNKVNLGEYYIVTPDERRARLKIGLFCLLYLALMAGIVLCAVLWARSQEPKAALVCRGQVGSVEE